MKIDERRIPQDGRFNFKMADSKGKMAGKSLDERKEYVLKTAKEHDVKFVWLWFTDILGFLKNVGLGYLSLSRAAKTLSGGEAQRVKLARELSRRATGRTLYVLDEPSVGLHAADVHLLIEVLQRLVEAGNSVLIIEHNLDIIKVADYLIDLGPEGGEKGGRLVAEGTPEDVCLNPESYTGEYLKAYLEHAHAARSELEGSNHSPVHS